MKSFIKYSLLLLVAVSVLYLFLKPEKNENQPMKAIENQPQQTTIENGVVVYYFHTSKRCPTCLSIESQADETIKNLFSAELLQGKLDWQVINTDEPENSHFVKDYKLYTKSIILRLVRNGKQVEWKNLPEIWELVHEPENYSGYLEKEILNYLGKV